MVQPNKFDIEIGFLKTNHEIAIATATCTNPDNANFRHRLRFIDLMSCMSSINIFRTKAIAEAVAYLHVSCNVECDSRCCMNNVEDGEVETESGHPGEEYYEHRIEQ